MRTANADEAKLASYTGVRREIADRVPPQARRVLDVGCSNGALGAHLMSLSPGRAVHGIEYDPELCAVAATRLPRVHCADINVDKVSRLVAGEHFDCVVCADVLEHVMQPDDVLVDVLRVLAPGGTVIISVPNIRHVSALASIAFGGTFPRRSRGIFDATHLRWFTRADLLALARDAGLSPERVDSPLRLFDAYGGRINSWLERHSASLGKLRVVAEFLGYQHVLQARLPVR